MKKFNWGWGITLFMICFISFMGYLTYKAFSIDFDLVAEDYYAQELEYEQRLTQLRNAAALESRPELILSNKDLRLVFPSGAAAEGIAGQLHFYDPASRDNDRYLDIVLDDKGEMNLPLNQLTSYRYTVKMSWSNKDTQYYHETLLVLK